MVDIDDWFENSSIWWSIWNTNLLVVFDTVIILFIKFLVLDISIIGCIWINNIRFIHLGCIHVGWLFRFIIFLIHNIDQCIQDYLLHLIIPIYSTFILMFIILRGISWCNQFMQIYFTKFFDVVLSYFVDWIQFKMPLIIRAFHFCIWINFWINLLTIISFNLRFVWMLRDWIWWIFFVKLWIVDVYLIRLIWSVDFLCQLLFIIVLIAI